MLAPISHQLFSATWDLLPDKVLMDVVVPEPYISTTALPKTVSVLKQFSPSVLSTTCFNPDNLPFQDEVRATELPHLFEHLLLDALVQTKAADTADTVTYRGKTRWNWKLNPVGTFTIEINLPESDHHYLPEALAPVMVTMDQLQQAHQ